MEIINFVKNGESAKGKISVTQALNESRERQIEKEWHVENLHKQCKIYIIQLKTEDQEVNDPF